MSDSEEKDESVKTVKASTKTLKILEELRRRDGARINELAEALGLAKGTVHHHLATLHERDYVVQEGNTYHVGLRFLGLGGLARHHKRIYRFSKEEVDNLADQLGETVQIIAEENGRCISIYQSEIRSDDLTTYLGTEVDFHCSAAGKAILANMPAERIDKIIGEGELPKYTENTITDPEELRQELQRIQTNMVAFDDEEQLSGVRCVSIPVKSPTGDALGAMSVSGIAENLSGEYFRESIPNLLRTSIEVIETNMAYSTWERRGSLR